MKVFSKIKFDFYKDAFKNAVNQQKELIPFLITQRLENEGIDSKGRQLRTDTAIEQSQNAYSRFTQSVKQKKGQTTSHVTLRDEGDFYNSIESEAGNGFVRVRSDMNKGGDNIYYNFERSYNSKERFVSSILDLADDDKRVFKNTILSNFRFQCSRLLSEVVRKAKSI